MFPKYVWANIKLIWSGIDSFGKNIFSLFAKKSKNIFGEPKYFCGCQNHFGQNKWHRYKRAKIMQYNIWTIFRNSDHGLAVARYIIQSTFFPLIEMKHYKNATKIISPEKCSA